MHQLASSVISILLSPLNWIIITLIAGYFFRKTSHKKKFILIAACIFIVFGNSFLLNWYASKWQLAPVTIKSSDRYSCGIVPGGFASIGSDNNPFFNTAADRFIQVLKLYKIGVINHILVSGGNGKSSNKNFHEGAWVKQELITVGIPDSVIFVEDRSNNTADNARYAKQILDSAKLVPPYLLITSAFHIPRAALLFKKAGVEVVPFPCNYTDGRQRFSFSSLFPQLSVLLGWNTFLKETAGYYWYKLK